MLVIIDRASAALLAAEGVLCFDTDTATATRSGHPVPWLPSQLEQAGPILVYGSSDGTVRLVIEHLERQGLAAWQVVERLGG